MITGAPPPTPPPHSPRTAGAKGIEQTVFDMMKRMRAEKESAEKVTVKSEPRDNTPVSEKKRKPAEEDVKRDPGSPPGFFTQKKPRHVPDRHDGDTGDREPDSAAAGGHRHAIAGESVRGGEALRRRRLEAANYASFSLGHALELEEKMAARERDADTLRQELAKAKAELVEAKAAAETRNAGEAAVREYLGSVEHKRRLAEHALGGYERGLEDMKRAALRRYPHLDPAELVVPPDGSSV